MVLPSELQYRPGLVVGLAAVEPPALAEDARLTMDMTAYEKDAVFTAGGERDGTVFLFRLEEPPDSQVLHNLFHTTALPPYTLEFFGQDGELLETVTNIDGLGG